GEHAAELLEHRLGRVVRGRGRPANLATHPRSGKENQRPATVCAVRRHHPRGGPARPPRLESTGLRKRGPVRRGTLPPPVAPPPRPRPPECDRMSALICGSLAYDTIMVFQDQFKNHILPDKVHLLN